MRERVGCSISSVYERWQGDDHLVHTATSELDLSQWQRGHPQLVSSKWICYVTPNQITSQPPTPLSLFLLSYSSALFSSFLCAEWTLSTVLSLFCYEMSLTLCVWIQLYLMLWLSGWVSAVEYTQMGSNINWTSVSCCEHLSTQTCKEKHNRTLVDVSLAKRSRSTAAACVIQTVVCGVSAKICKIKYMYNVK